MRLLVLDDDPIRHDAFRNRHEKRFEVHSVYDADGAIEALKRFHFDVATLDHDLGTGYPDGSQFVDMMLTQVPPERWPQSVMVHSHNPVGALRMTERLRDAGIPSRRAPFKP